MSKFQDRCKNLPSAELLAEGKEVVDFFKPDLSADSELFNEVDSMNGISIAESKHELANVMRMRLQEVANGNLDLPDFQDNDLLDAMFTKNDEIEDIYLFAREQEKQFKNQ